MTLEIPPNAAQKTERDVRRLEALKEAGSQCGRGRTGPTGDAAPVAASTCNLLHRFEVLHALAASIARCNRPCAAPALRPTMQPSPQHRTNTTAPGNGASNGPPPEPAAIDRAQPPARRSPTSTAEPGDEQRPEGTHERGHRWAARFGISWTTGTITRGGSGVNSQPGAGGAIGPGSLWTARLGVSWTNAASAGVLDSEDESSEEDTIRTGGLDSEDESPEEDTTGRGNQWFQWTAPTSAEQPAEADGEQPVDNATRAVAEIEQCRRQLEEMAVQKCDAERSRDIALHVVDRLGAMLQLLSANPIAPRGLRARASAAERERDMAYRAAREAEEQREMLATQLSEMRSNFCASERETERFKTSVEGEVEELRERLARSEAENGILQVRVQTARRREEEHKTEREGMQYELDARQERNRELNREVTSYRERLERASSTRDSSG